MTALQCPNSILEACAELLTPRENIDNHREAGVRSVAISPCAGSAYRHAYVLLQSKSTPPRHRENEYFRRRL